MVGENQNHEKRVETKGFDPRQIGGSSPKCFGQCPRWGHSCVIRLRKLQCSTERGNRIMISWADFVIVGAIFFIPVVIVNEIKVHAGPKPHWMFRAPLRSYSSWIFFILLFLGLYFQDHPKHLVSFADSSIWDALIQVNMAFSRVFAGQ